VLSEFKKNFLECSNGSLFNNQFLLLPKLIDCRVCRSCKAQGVPL